MRVDNLPDDNYFKADEQAIKRALSLGKSATGSGHCNYLKGIRVMADFTAPNYVWPEIQRYNFLDIVSSQSKMHRLTTFLEMPNASDYFCEYVDPRAIQLAKEYAVKYQQNPNKKTFEMLVANTPLGMELTAGISTNYLQLKTMYFQRKGHKMRFWREIFIDWCSQLPLFLELIGELEGNVDDMLNELIFEQDIYEL
jgi:hypothetical protein